MLKKIIFLLIILAVLYFVFKPFNNNTKVLGVSTGNIKVPGPIQGIMNSISTSAVNAAIQPLISQINNLPTPQKNEIKKAICK